MRGKKAAISTGYSESIGKPDADSWSHRQEAGCRFPYPSHYIRVLDAQMHYVDEGDSKGPPIVLVHGNPTSSYVWRNVIPHLAERGRIIAPDLIGMGKSGKPDLGYRLEDHLRYFDAFIEALALRDVVLVLHGWGGAVGMDHAMRNRDNIRAIAFMEALLLPLAWGAMSAGERRSLEALRGPKADKLVMEENFVVESLLPSMAGRQLTEVEMAHYRSPYLERAHRKPLRVWSLELPIIGDGPTDNLERLARVYEALMHASLPLLLLTAEPGSVIKPSQVEILRADLPHMEVQSIGQGRHLIQESQPEAIGQALDVWLSKLSTVSAVST